MSGVLEGRINNLHYCATTYQKITHLLNFFYENFYIKNNEYNCRLYYFLRGKAPCLSIILNGEGIWGYSIKDWKTKEIYMYADYKGDIITNPLVYVNCLKKYLGEPPQNIKDSIK